MNIPEKSDQNNDSFPAWLKRPWGIENDISEVRKMLRHLGLNTVCQSAHCPNRGECWGKKTATFMILGTVCTRNCRFCAVSSGFPGKEISDDEPERVGQAVAILQVRHVVITSVTRDDLPDGGARHFARTLESIKRHAPATTREVLVPDFQGNSDALQQVLEERPSVFAHNIETVERLFPSVRSRGATYQRSLNILSQAASYGNGIVIKSGFMVGLGESARDVYDTLVNLRDAGCKIVTIGQYLRPTVKQVPVVDFIPPEQFQEYEQMAYELGFSFVVSGPFVRSSYRSGEAFRIASDNSEKKKELFRNEKRSLSF